MDNQDEDKSWVSYAAEGDEESEDGTDSDLPNQKQIKVKRGGTRKGAGRKKRFVPSTQINEFVKSDVMTRLAIEKLDSLLKAGATAKEINAAFEPFAAARQVLMIFDQSMRQEASLLAARDLQDRVSGKPVETKKMEHEYSKMTMEQLDALLHTALAKGLSNVDEKGAILDLIKSDS